MVGKKRILVVHNSYQIRGGEDIVFENEVQMLRKAGYEVETYERSNCEFANVGILRKVRIALESFFSVKTYKDINRIIVEKSIDILHIHNTFFLVSSAVYFSAFKNRIPVVQTLHNFRLVCPNGLLMREGKICEECMSKGLKCALIHRCYRNSLLETFLMVTNLWLYRKLGILQKSHFICMTEFNKKKLIESKVFKKLGLSESQFFVKNHFVANTKKTNELDDPVSPPFFLYSGRLSQEKGIYTLLEAWTFYKTNLDVHDKRGDFKLVILGDGTLMKECRDAATQIGDDSIELKGFVSKEIVNHYMQHAVATIVPSECYEGVSLAVMEAFANGCPVIGSDIGNIKLTVKPGMNGYHFRAGDSQSLAETILYVSKHRDEEMKKGAFDTFEKYYSEERNLQVLEEIYAKISGETQYGEG